MKKIIAHRGLSLRYPENSVAAFEATHRYGVEWLETDISILGDGTVIIMHDDTLDRTTNQSGHLAELSAADIAATSVGEWFGTAFKDEPIPRLADLIACLNRTKLNINFELKAVVGNRGNELADEVVAQLAEAITQLNPAIKISISSFNPLMLLKMKAYHPDLDYAVLFETHTLEADWPLIMAAVGARAIHLENEGLSQHVVQTAVSLGYEVNVWTVNTRERTNELFNWGVTGVFSDKADELLSLTKKEWMSHERLT
ncbi:glycerophosphodiester phosphodiesterase family protein [Brochothrix campestris]|uniref:Glycerophosphoryl diester phosphodiesterase n=1 Tax=Brochothrix campestris FSL F6-1037 TaxID=1265861 RepID=W7CJZ8_9LIST|nr:glycerophosphodiester phosphodiesterase family protein [Brochothrix campestris]EUJ37125.1 glycerophosphoryl diester phosphodiesterase [Brochothrix campestris FSL F6-1037]